MTSQANHLQKLLSLLSEVQRQSHHMQRLYKRRRSGRFSNIYRSTWKENFSRSVFDDDTSIWQKHRNKRTRNKKEFDTTDQSDLEVNSNAGE